MKTKRFMLTIAAMSAAVMEVLDLTIVNVALPDMQGAMSANPDEISWVLTSYLITTAIFMPLSGYFVATLGRKYYFSICIVGFTIASGLCGIATSLEEIVIARLIQGAFGAGLVPLSQSIMIQIYPTAERGKAMTIWGMGITLAPIFGPSFGGLLIEYINWRWVFYINIPVCIIAFIIVLKEMDETEIIKRHMDWIGFLLLGTGLGCLQFTLDRGNTEDWFSSGSIWITSLFAIGGIISYIYYSVYYDKHPIFNLKIFADRNYTACCIIMTFMGIGLFGSLIIQPIMMSLIFNYTAWNIGLAMAPRGLASFCTMLLVGRIMTKYPVRNIIFCGILINILSNYIAATYYNVNMDFFWITAPFILQGIGLGMIFTPLATQCMITLPKEYVNEASGIFNLMRTIGGGIGIALSITYFTRKTQVFTEEFGSFINPFNLNLQGYLQQAHLHLNDPRTPQILAMEIAKQAHMQAIINVFYMLMFCFAVMIPLLFLLKNKTFDHVEIVPES